ncbi:MAG: hypothetical protein AAB534_01465 [Patescibacteria group bacterium]
METGFFSFLIKYDSLWRFFHIAGVIIALGSVVMADLVLVWLKFKPKEANLVAKITPMLSLQVWLGLIIISISGLFMFLPNPGIAGSSIFQFKMFLVLIVFLNGILLNVWITPKFEKLVPEWSQNTLKVKSFTKIAGIATAVSFFSWWGIIVLMELFY